jgi:hypothetical protein
MLSTGFGKWEAANRFLNAPVICQTGRIAKEQLFRGSMAARGPELQGAVS